MPAALTVVEHRSGSYAPRTWHNASVAALTVAFAVDFSTAGEKLTAKAAHGKHVSIRFADDPAVAAAELLRHWRPHGGGTLNVAGNGIYTLSKHGWTQARVDAYVLDVLQQVHREAPFGRIVSGGQTGVDLAGAIAGVALNVDTVVTLPKGFLQRHADGKDRVQTREEVQSQVEEALARAKDAAFRADVERRFGSDEAIGVTFVRDDTGERLNVAEMTALMKTFSNKADGPGAESFMPDGGSACCCTEYAHHIARRLPGHRVAVVGFANEDNPSSRVAREEIHPGGHDFAVVDGRYIVDPWVRLVAGVEDQIVFDLEDAAEALRALDIYGPRECWAPLPMDDNDNQIGKEKSMARLILHPNSGAFGNGQRDVEAARILEETARRLESMGFGSNLDLRDITDDLVGRFIWYDENAGLVEECMRWSPDYLMIGFETAAVNEVAQLLRDAAARIRDGEWAFTLSANGRAAAVASQMAGAGLAVAVTEPAPGPDRDTLNALLRDGVAMLSAAVVGRSPKAASAKQWLRSAAAATPSPATEGVCKTIETVATCIKDALSTGSVPAQKAASALAAAHAALGEDVAVEPARNACAEMEP